MDTPLLLSISIATMNRAALLDETLASLWPDSGPDVEWVIVDGSEDAQTESVIKKWRSSFPNIQYRRTPPRGVDRDYALCVELSRGKYCWLMTDDDLVRPGAIAAIRKAAKKNYSLIILNAEVFNTDFSKVLEPARLRFKTDREYSPDQFELFFKDTIPYLSFIGGAVIRRDIWMNRSAEPYWGTEFVHVGIIFQQPLLEPVLVIAKPYIRIRYGNALWTARAFRIWMFNWPRLIWSFPHVSNDAKRMICDPKPYLKLNELVKTRAKGCYSVKEYREWLRSLLKNPIRKFLAYAIAVFPGNLLNTICIAYLKSRYPQAKALLLDFQRSRFSKRGKSPFLSKLFL